jgi:hypothetical protein
MEREGIYKSRDLPPGAVLASDPNIQREALTLPVQGCQYQEH